MSEASRGNGTSPEEDSDDGLWTEFENCAQAIAHLFRGANWRNLQTAAASTTQLYKSGLDAKKRAFEKGFVSGRQALAKEVFALCSFSDKINVEDVVTLLSRYTDLQEAHALSPQRRQRSGTVVQVAENNAAVKLFQQALCPSDSPSYRAPELNNFLQHQLHRHRKRQHSPTSQVMNSDSSTAILSKRLKRLP